MTVLTFTDDSKVNPVESEPSESETLPAGAVITKGDVVRMHATNGKWVLAKATTAALAGFPYIAYSDANIINREVTAMRRGKMYMDTALDALNFGAPVYLSDTDGAMDSAAGTVSVLLGHVIPIWNGSGTIRKALKVECAGTTGGS